MTIETQTPRVVFIGNGGRGPFTLQDGSGNPIRLRIATDLVVWRYASTTDEVGEQLVYSTDFTVTNTDPDNASFSLTVAQDVLTSSQRLLAYRSQDVAQDLNLTLGGQYGGPADMAQRDIVTEQIQELRRDVDRAVKADWRATTVPALPLPPSTGLSLLGRNAAGEIVYAGVADIPSGTPVDADWLALLELDPSEALGWYNVLAYGAVGDGVTDDLAAIHACRDAAGPGATIFFPAGTYLLSSNISIANSNQTWLFDDNATLKVANGSTAALMRILAAGTKIRNLSANNNRSNAPNGGGIIVSADGTAVSTAPGPANVEIDFRDIYECGSYGVYAINAPGIKVTATRMAGFTTTPIFIFLSAGSGAIEGPIVKAEIDLTAEDPNTYNHPAVIIRGREGGGNRFKGGDFDIKARLPDDADNSTVIALELKAVDYWHAKVHHEGGAMCLSLAECKGGSYSVAGGGASHYTVEFGGGCEDITGYGPCDVRNPATNNPRGLYPLAFQGPSGGGVGLNKNCWHFGSLHGATAAQSILLDNAQDCGWMGTANLGLSNYMIYADEQNGFDASGIFNGESGGDFLAYLRNATGRMNIRGRASGFDNGGIGIEADTAITIDNVSMSVTFEDSAGGGYSTTLSGGAVLGDNITAQNCGGQFFGSSSRRGQVLNLKRALYDIEGTGSPEAAVTAGIGSIYRRIDGSDGAALYIKSSGSGNTGWDAAPYYEEGTFNATITFATPGNLSVSYANQLCTYTRRGNRVEVGVNLVFTPTFTTASGALRIAGMPFTIANDQDTAGMIRDITSQFTWPASRTQLVVYPNSATSYLTIQAIGSGQNPSDIAASNMTSGAAHTLRLSVSYRI